MATRPERIEHLLERSSLGDTEARRARARVPDATAHALLAQITAGSGRSGRQRTVRSSKSSGNSKNLGRPRGTASD